MCSDSKPPTPKHCLILPSPRHQLPMNQRCLAATPKHWYMDLNEAAETHHRKTDSFWLWQFLLFFLQYGGAISGCNFLFLFNSFCGFCYKNGFCLNGFLHIPSCSAPHSMWSQTVTDRPVSFQYNLRGNTPPRHRWSYHKMQEFPPQVGENNFYQLLHLVKHNPLQAFAGMSVWDSKPAWRTPAQRPSPELGGIFAARE